MNALTCIFPTIVRRNQPALLLSLLLAFLLPLPLQAGARYAVVIGNAAYPGGGPTALNGAEDAAQAVSRQLRALGFEVLTQTNTGYDEMRDAAFSFRTKAKGADIALFYFLGYSVQHRDGNYLLPVNAKIASELDVRAQSINLGDVMNEMDVSGARAKLLLLDAASPNPWQAVVNPARQGLIPLKPSSEMLISYPDAPSRFTPDARLLFTQSFLRLAPTSGEAIENLLLRVREDVMARSGNAQRPYADSTLNSVVHLLEPYQQIYQGGNNSFPDARKQQSGLPESWRDNSIPLAPVAQRYAWEENLQYSDQGVRVPDGTPVFLGDPSTRSALASRLKATGVQTVAYVDTYEGRFWMSKWAYQQWLRGQAPTWIYLPRTGAQVSEVVPLPVVPLPVLAPATNNWRKDYKPYPASLPLNYGGTVYSGLSTSSKIISSYAPGGFIPVKGYVDTPSGRFWLTDWNEAQYNATGKVVSWLYPHGKSGRPPETAVASNSLMAGNTPATVSRTGSQSPYTGSAPVIRATPARPSAVPFAIPARGYPGYVISPHAPTSGLVDVRGARSGQVISCPYTGRPMILP